MHSVAWVIIALLLLSTLIIFVKERFAKKRAKEAEETKQRETVDACNQYTAKAKETEKPVRRQRL